MDIFKFEINKYGGEVGHLLVGIDFKNPYIGFLGRQFSLCLAKEVELQKTTIIIIF